MADFEGERLRRLAIVVKAEREIKLATRLALVSLIAEIAKDYLDEPVVAAARHNEDGRHRINGLWGKMTRQITQKAGDLFAKRFRLASRDDSRLMIAIGKFLNGVSEHLKGVPDEIYADLDKIVRHGRDAKLGDKKTQELLKAEITPGHEAYGKRLDVISDRVSRTLAISAFNGGDQEGHVAAAQAAGHKMLTKRWLSSHDTKVRPTHAEADGQVVDLDQDFTVGGFAAQFPGDWRLPPQEACNCRCTSLYSNGSVVAGVEIGLDEKPLRVNMDTASIHQVDLFESLRLQGLDGGSVCMFRSAWDQWKVKNSAANLALDDQEGQHGLKNLSGIAPCALPATHDVPVGVIRGGLDVDDPTTSDLLYGLKKTDMAVGDQDLLLVAEPASAKLFLRDVASPLTVDEASEIGESVRADVHKTIVSQVDAPSSNGRLADMTTPETDITTPDGEPVGGTYDTDGTLPDGWRGPIAALDVPTSDRRMLATPKGGIKTRAYPLTLTRNHVGDPTGYPTIGSVDNVWMQDGLLMGEGRFDLGSDEGQDASRQLAGGFLNRVSIDPVEVSAENRAYNADGEPLDLADGDEMPEGAYSVTTFTDWTLAGLAMVPIPAYTQAAVEPVYGYQPTLNAPDGAIVASVGGQIFTSKFFADPSLSEPTPLTVTEDGHVFGHVRLAGTCYQYGGGQGNGGFCLEPPASACGYAKFMVQGAKMDDGSIKAVGALTFGEGHESRGSLAASQAHYNNVATIAAKGIVGDDEFGVWFSGEVTDNARDKAYDLLLSPMSGHWEPDSDSGHLELMAIHIVVTPGYTVRRIVAGFDDAGAPNSLIITTYPDVPIKEEATPVMTETPSARAAVVAALADIKRAEALAKVIGIDPESRLARANERIALAEAIIAASSGGGHIAATSTPWDGPAAAASIFAHATKNGKIDQGIAAQAFLAHTGDGSKKGDWHLPVARVVGGVIQIVPRGVAAAASRVDQTQGIDQAAAKSKINGLYKRIHAAYPSWPASPGM